MSGTEQLPEGADAGLRVDGVVVFSDTWEEIEADLAAELELDRARDAVIALARDLAAALPPMGAALPHQPIVLGEHRVALLLNLRSALEWHAQAKAQYPNATAE